MKVLGHRVLVTPDEMPQESASGIILPEARDYQPTSGTVQRVGNGSARDARVRTAAIRKCIEILASGGTTKDLAAYQAACELASNVAEGDHVIFPAECGLLITEGQQTYILLNEDDIVVCEREAV